jgi:copper(I)-binding protein
MRVNIFCACFLALALLLPVTAPAGQTITAENIRARETPPGAVTGAAYLTLINNGQENDRLLEVSGDVADSIEVHTHLMEDGMMKMRPVDGVDISTDKPAVFEPGGLHIMLIGLKAPLKTDEVFPLTLKFEKADDLTVEVVVKAIGSM